MVRILNEGNNGSYLQVNFDLLPLCGICDKGIENNSYGFSSGVTINIAYRYAHYECFTKKENKVSKALKTILADALSYGYKLVKYDTTKCDITGCYGDCTGDVVVTEWVAIENTKTRVYHLCSDHYTSFESRVDGL